MTPDLFWIPGPWRGRLAITGRPRGGEWLGDEARALRQAGVDVLVSLLERNESEQLGLADEAGTAEANGLRFIPFPIPDRDVPASTMDSLALISNLGRALEAGSNVAVHCRQSVGRAGLIAAAVLAASGLDPERAIVIVSQTRGETVPETPEQRAWLLRVPIKPAAVTS